MGADGRPVLHESRVKPDVLSLPDDQSGPALAIAVSRDDGRDSIKPRSIRILVSGSREHLGKTADVLARGPGCEPLGPARVELLELDAPDRPVLRVRPRAQHETLPPGGHQEIVPRSRQRAFGPPRSTRGRAPGIRKEPPDPGPAASQDGTTTEHLPERVVQRPGA
jgi:hypothetical protein